MSGFKTRILNEYGLYRSSLEKACILIQTILSLRNIFSESPFLEMPSEALYWPLRKINLFYIYRNPSFV